MTAPALVEGDVLVLAETLTHAVAAAMNLGYSRKYVSGLATLDRARGRRGTPGPGPRRRARTAADAPDGHDRRPRRHGGHPVLTPRVHSRSSSGRGGRRPAQ